MPHERKMSDVLKVDYWMQIVTLLTEKIISAREIVRLAVFSSRF
jgi:hypothetical protein